MLSGNVIIIHSVVELIKNILLYKKSYCWEPDN